MNIDDEGWSVFSSNNPIIWTSPSELPNPESKSQIAANSSSLLLHRSRPSLRPFVASSSNHVFSGSALQAFSGSALRAIRSSQLLHRSRIHPVSPFLQPVQATTIASSHSEFMDSNTLMDDVNNPNRDDDDDDGDCVDIDDVGAGQLKKTGKRKREKKRTTF
ncbi:hypothetical protein LXL04_020557 [Taraxacum kok-saghyz]